MSTRTLTTGAASAAPTPTMLSQPSTALPTSIRFDSPVEQADALEMASLVFTTAVELTISSMASGEPLNLRDSLEAALYDLRPAPDEQRAIHAIVGEAYSILSGFYAVKGWVA